VIALSQSGETADVLAFLEEVKQTDAKIVSYVNMPGSMMSQMADISIMAQAGPEKSVMSSKVFSSQGAWGYWLARAVANEADEARREIGELSNSVEEWLEDKANLKRVEELAEALVDEREVFIMGAGSNGAVAKETMIKLIEGAYIHAHAIPAGDLKHYAITLMEPGVVVLALTPTGEAGRTMKNAVAEVRARGAKVIEVGGDKLGAEENLPLPYSTWLGGLGEIVPMQLLTYYLAKMKGHNIDKPRNIAKSVTVL
jgi:glucosamine--fructose-6-phosphate aminotransferase (isomerizing)